MSKTIDQRVVEMRFDNKQFESATAQSMSTIDKLKQKLNFTGASKGLEEVSSAAKKVDMSGLGSAVEAVRVKFSSLQVIGVTALTNIANSAVNAGKRIVSALTIDPVMTGFQEYETQINAIQTILANTSNAGTTLGQVNAALDELNTYADKTIYNFTEMTRNIGTFTAAGVDLDTSVSAIKGIANLAAVSGSTSQQASTAMYQLSQAIAAGRVSLEDWNSVVNAGMGGKVFQDALKNTAKAMGIVVDETKSFRESISATGGQKSWLTSDVLLNTLKQFTGDLNNAELAAMGFNETQIASIQQMAVTANDAATKVKTVSQLWDTMKESVQSGWTQTWEILIGDFEEAKSLLTEVSDTLGGMIGKSSEARNALLYDALTSNWKKVTDGITEAGLSAEEYQSKVTEVAKKQGVDVDAMVKEYGSLEAAFKNGAISSKVLSDALISMTGTADENKKKLADLSGEYTNGASIMQALTKAGYDLTDQQELLNKVTQGQAVTLNDCTDAQLRSLGYTDQQIESIRQLSANLELSSGSLQEFIDNVSKPMGRENLIDALRISFRSLVDIFGTVHDAWIDVFPPTTSDQLLGITESIKNFALALRPSAKTLDQVSRSFKGLFSVFSLAKQAISALLSPIGDLFGGFGDLGGGIMETVASFGDWLVSLDQAAKAGDVFSALSDGISGFIKKVQDGVRSVVDGIGGFSGAFSAIGDGISWIFEKVFDVVSGVVNWIRENITAGDIFAGLAGGGIFVAFQKFGDLIDKVKGIFDGFGDSAGGIGDAFSDILGSVHDTLESFSQGIQVASLVGIATAVTLLTSSLRKISELDPGQIAYSLVTIRLLIASLTSGFKSLTKTLSKFDSKGSIKASIAMIAIAEAINILADAMTTIAALDLAEIGKGLVGVGGAMAELVIAMKFLDGAKINLRTSVAMIAIAEACKILSEAVSAFSTLNWDEIARGLVAMGGALAEVTAAVVILSKVGGGGALLGSAGIFITVQSLGELANSLKSFAEMQWDEIGRGLAAMGGALAEVGVVTGALGKFAGFSSIFASGAIFITVQSLGELATSLQSFASMAWDEIGRGLTAMGGALAEVGIVTGALGKLAGFSGILGSGAILIVVQGLQDLANALQSFGSMSWEEIGRGLAAMGGALLEVGAVSGGLGMLTGISGLFGAGTIWIAVQGLQDLATALQSFGSMSWEEIGRGLVAMGGALLEVGAISGALGAFTGIAGLVGAGTITLASQGLDEIATALLKFASMSWDEIGRGLTAMAGALGEVALGGLLSTFSGLGAAAISEMAEPLGQLADSVKRWTGVTVPEGLGLQLGSLAIGVKAFNFAGWGADAIAAMATPLGSLATSISKWSNVTVPDGLGEQLSSLAPGIESFNFAGWGADAIAALAIPLGDLAGSVQKWSTVTITEELGTQLTSLANGVKSFSFAFIGGWSISSLVEPLGNLADTVKKWNTVKVPEGMEENLTGLANGVKSFNTSFFGNWSIGGLVEPLTNLAEAVNAWSNVNVSGLGAELTELSAGLTTLGNVGVKNLLSAMDGAADKAKTSIDSMLSGIQSSIDSYSPKIKSSFSDMMDGSLDAVESKNRAFYMAAQEIVLNLENGINSKKNTLTKSLTDTLSSMVTSIRSKYSEFYNAGGYLVQGFANGISASTYMATAKAQAMAQAAETAAKNALGVHSPSTVFEEIGENTVEGYEKGIAEKMPAVADSGEELGDSMIEATKHALDITSDSSKLAEEVIGVSFVKGITEGIEKDDTAEEAAEKKAQNIVTAFENALEKVDLSSSTNDLKSQIWDALSENLVSEGQSEAAKLDSLLKEYEYQTQRLELAKAEYQTMVDQFGESSDNAKESYNKYLQEQLDLVNTFNEIVELKKSVSEREGDVLDRQEEQLEREYDLWSEKALGDEEELNRAQSALLDLAKLTERYEIQVKRVESAKAYYDSLSQAFGKDSKNALEAYDAYLDEYSEQTELSTELYQAQVDQMQWGVTSYGKYLDALKEQKKKNLLSEGLSEEEADKKIDSLFRNFNKSTESIAAFVDEFREIVTGSFATVASDTTTAYMESVDETFGPMTEEFKQYGESYAEALNEGFKEGMASSNSDKVVVNAGSAEVDSGSKSDLFAQMQDMFSPITGESSTLNQDISSVFNNLGKNAMSEFVSGMQSEISNVDSLSSSVTSMIEQISQEMQNALGGDSFSAQGQMDTATVPEMAQPLLVFFQTLAEYIRVLFAETYQKTWFDVGVQILTFIINGIEDTTPEMENIVQTFMNNFLNAVLWFESMFYQAGQTLALSILYGFKSEEYRFIQYANELGVTVGSAMVAGFESGMASARSYIRKTGDTMVESVVNAAMSAMDAHSPSRLFMKIGSYIPLGFAIGINNGKDKAVNSALSMVQDTISRVAEAVDGGMNVEPTIRPVLDLSNVEEGTKRISAVFSRNQALSIDRSMSGRSTISSDDQNGDTTSDSSGATFSFVQNNYSPKSLSRVEIYRQTKNQFSTFQRMVRV